MIRSVRWKTGRKKRNGKSSEERNEMKTLFSTLAVLVLIMVANAATVVAQCDPNTKQAVYQVFLDNRRATTIEGLQKAVDAGKKYLEMCKDSPDDQEVVAYLNRLLPRVEQNLAVEIRFSRFETASKAQNYGESFKVGREILANEPKDSELKGDLSIYLTWAGYKAMESADVASTMSAIELGRETIAMINSGAKFVDWGAYDGIFKQQNDADSKSHTLGWLNFAIAEMYVKVDNKPEAMAHYFETTKYGAPIGSNPVVFQAIGAWYLSDAIRVRAEGVKIYEANGDQDTEESTKLFNLAKGYADRAFDAYARAYQAAKVAKNDSATNSLYGRLGELYKFRFDGKEEGLEDFILEVGKRPFIDPRNPVEPIIEEETPATTPQATQS